MTAVLTEGSPYSSVSFHLVASIYNDHMIASKMLSWLSLNIICEGVWLLNFSFQQLLNKQWDGFYSLFNERSSKIYICL